jgi:hypothetical protein
LARLIRHSRHAPGSPIRVPTAAKLPFPPTTPTVAILLLTTTNISLTFAALALTEATLPLAPSPLPLAIPPLTFDVIQPPLFALLTSAVGRAKLLPSRIVLALLAAISLSAIAVRADHERCPAAVTLPGPEFSLVMDFTTYLHRAAAAISEKPAATHSGLLDHLPPKITLQPRAAPSTTDE